MDIKAGDYVKILEPYANMKGEIGLVKDVFESKWNTDITVEFRLTAQRAMEIEPYPIFSEGIEYVIHTEIYQPFQLLRIPATTLGRLLYV